MKVYFDNAATTPLHPRVYEKMKRFMIRDFGNASSIHSFGRPARVAIEEARETIAAFINANPSEIYFTSGGTEANNFAVFGIARGEYTESGRNHIVTTQSEHHSVLDSFGRLETEGFQVDRTGLEPSSQIDPDKLKEVLNNRTSFVSLIHINNETGAVNPIAETARRLKELKILCHSDTVQSFGKIKIDTREMGVDSISGSAHKINGPKGTGFAFVKSGTPLSPLLFGGSQERNRRGGTENVSGIAGFAEAVRIAQNDMSDNLTHVESLKAKFLNGLAALDPGGIRINGGSGSSPYLLSMTFRSEYYNNDAEGMLMFLDIHGIAASNGAACTSGTLKPSHVILNSGYTADDANGTIRFSFGRQNTKEEVDYTLEIIQKMARKFGRR
jgi:cysteine desulfurase